MLKLSILAVDDSPVITEMIRDAFETEGYNVLTAQDGAEALKVSLQEHPDLIIADVAMPGMDGWELCSQIRTNPFTSFIPFIFLTARSQAPDRIKGLQMGADDYLTKPFEMDELIARVQLIFQRMRKTQESMLLKEQRSLSGSTKEMALPDLLQLFGINQKSGLLKISRMGFPSGGIAMEAGRIIGARLGAARGEKALYRLLSWQDANFEVSTLSDWKGGNDLGHSVEEALMEGMRQIDELALMEKEYPLAGKRLKVLKKPGESELSPREEQVFAAIDRDNEVSSVIDALPMTDYDAYKTVIYFIRKGILTAD